MLELLKTRLRAAICVRRTFSCLDSMQDGFQIIAKETFTAIKEENLLMQLLNVKPEGRILLHHEPMGIF